MKKTAIPKLISWLFLTGLTFLIFMTIMRVIFFFHFRTNEYSFQENTTTFLMGFQFDLRIVCLIVLFPFILGNLNLKYNFQERKLLGNIIKLVISILILGVLLFLISKKFLLPLQPLIFATILPFILILVWLYTSKNCNPFESDISRKVIKSYFFFVSLLIPFLYAIDFQHYDYLHERLNTDVLRFTNDAKTSMDMVWESYPVITILLLTLISTALIYTSILNWFKRISKQNRNNSVFAWVASNITFALFIGVGIFGNLNLYPLRYSNALKWSDAFNLQDNFKGNLALNPIQSILSTLQVGSSSYDLKKVKEYYPLLVSDLDIKYPDSANLNFNRNYQAPPTLDTPNIILVICESFASYKSSMWGNPLNTTPYFNELCNQGVFFDRCFTPGYGTSRGVWATITGIPDVEYPNTSSGNPAFVDQQSILNDYKGYEKFYFIGGNAGFENIGALFNNNIDGIKIYEEKDFKSKRINVWGISDKRLFLEANNVLQNQSRPFFAVIQTSGNHRPYTFAEEDKKEFKLENYPLDTLEKYGFGSNEELNAFRYTDFSFKVFIETAKSEKYFKNTIFVFVGDHGTPGVPANMFPRAWEFGYLCYNHVPLLFYSPSLLLPERINRTVSQLDVLPSVSALAKISYTNSTLGQNLFDTIKSNSRLNNARFLFNSNERVISVVTDLYLYTFNLISGKEEFQSAKDDLPLPLTLSVQEDKKEIKTMANAYFETAKYMLSNNKKKP